MDYVTAIGLGFPGVGVSCSGDPEVYEDVVWEQGLAMPSKAALDSWIASNTTAESQKITVLAFRQRFTQNEKIALEFASLDNPAAAIETRQFAAALRVMLADLNVAQFVDLSRADTRGGVQLLETNGIIGVGRATIILDTPASAGEAYKHPANG